MPHSCPASTTFRSCPKPTTWYLARRPGSGTGCRYRVLTQYLPVYFSAADRFHRSSRSDWFSAFLERYPSPHIIVAMGNKAFIADAREAIGRSVSKERFLTDIYQLAKTSVGFLVDPRSDAITMFRRVLAEGRSLIEQRNEIKDRAVALRKDNPGYHLLKSILGIGPINALTTLAKAGDLRRFGHHRQFLKFFGMRCPAGDCVAIDREGTLQPFSPACSGGRPSYQNTATPDFAALCRWRVKSPFCSAPTASVTSSSVSSQEITTTPICAVRPIPQSPPK
jgi:hypothetical protein